MKAGLFSKLFLLFSGLSLYFIIFLFIIFSFLAHYNINHLSLKFIFITTTFFLLPAVAYSYFFAKLLARPFEEFILRLKAPGTEFLLLKTIYTNSELKEINKHFEYLEERYEKLQKLIEGEKERLSVMYLSLNEGLVILDEAGKILYFNNCFLEIFETNEPLGRFYWEIIRESSFDASFKTLMNNRNLITSEMHYKDRIFKSHFIYINKKKEIIVTFSDITELKRVERIKKDIIVNVSHELRTPLTLIKGFAETLFEELQLKEDIGKELIDYTGIIINHSDRLIRLVKDLLVLSELEEREVKLEIAPVNLKEIIENVTKIFEHRLKEKNIEFLRNYESEKLFIAGDFFRLEQVFINLLDNSIKYTDKGQILLSLKQKSEKELQIAIKDTGIGIDGVHLPRIFERFYVADKSRSRKQGGTGLGLSIVKHIVLLHNGRISIESVPSSGTSIEIIFPIFETEKLTKN